MSTKDHDGGTYPMKAVARLTGLSPDTIRAWERRYGAISPARTEGDHRLYSERDVERLRLLRLATEAGHGIGRVARLDEDALRRLAGERAGRAPSAAAHGVPARVLALIARYDVLGAERELARVAALLPPRRLVHEVVVPLLAAVGDRWCEGELTVGQEHLVTALVRSLLGTLLRLADPPPGQPPIVLATLSGERHELGALMVALLAAASGVPSLYLGADTPPAELALAARRTRAIAVGVSLVRVDDPAGAASTLAELASALPARVPLWLGGGDVGRLAPEQLPAGARVMTDLLEVEAAIADLR